MNSKTITITIAGPVGTGKTFLKYMIGKMIKKKLGFKVEIEELEMKTCQIAEMNKNKKSIKKSLKEAKISCKIREIHLKNLLSDDDLKQSSR